MSERPFDGVVFDFDGTLVHQTIDFAKMRADVRGVVARFGVDDPAILDQHILELIDSACEELGRRGNNAHAMRAEAYAAIDAVELAAAEHARPFLGVRSMLQQLRLMGVRLGVITRNSGQSARLAFRDVEQEVSAFLPREAVRHVKPHPEHLGTCIDRLGVAPTRALMVGDHTMDIETGKRSGTSTAGVLTGNSTTEAFEAAGADYILDDVTDVLGLFGAP